VSLFETELKPSPGLAEAFLLAVISPIICYWTAWWEIVSTYKGRAVLAILGFLLASAFTQGATAILLALLPHLYWLARIKGVPFANDT
jgi:hypothetical protein